MPEPEIVAELKPLFRPRSVAVIGATNNMSKWGFLTFTSLKNLYKGELYAVNNRDKNILGFPSYPKVTDIPGSVDLAIIVIPAENVAGVMEDCVEKGVKAGVIITAGFAETGRKGRALGLTHALQFIGSTNNRPLVFWPEAWFIHTYP